jgi:preprotein translocase subunit SecG
MYGILIVIHLIVAILLIGLVLLQHGKGASAGAAFGSGASNTIFGSQGSGNFLSRTTGMLAAAFFVINLSLGYLTTKANRPDVIQKVEQSLPGEVQQQPVVPAGDDLPE